MGRWRQEDRWLRSKGRRYCPAAPDRLGAARWPFAKITPPPRTASGLRAPLPKDSKRRDCRDVLAPRAGSNPQRPEDCPAGDAADLREAYVQAIEPAFDATTALLPIAAARL